MFFRSRLGPSKNHKNRAVERPVAAKSAASGRQGVAGEGGLGAPGAASRARYRVKKRDKATSGEGSDTPWAIGPANYVVGRLVVGPPAAKKQFSSVFGRMFCTKTCFFINLGIKIQGTIRQAFGRLACRDPLWIVLLSKQCFFLTV